MFTKGSDTIATGATYPMLMTGGNMTIDLARSLRAPELVVYGDIREVTKAAGSSTKNDGGTLKQLDKTA